VPLAEFYAPNGDVTYVTLITEAAVRGARRRIRIGEAIQWNDTMGAIPTVHHAAVLYKFVVPSLSECVSRY
jgi:hypothetical protein